MMGARNFWEARRRVSRIRLSSRERPARRGRARRCRLHHRRDAPPPRPQPSEEGEVSPERGEVTGFVFKVQANMDPQHRDRIAFMRLVSGTFKRGMKLVPSGLGKPIAVHSPILFFAQDRELADTAEALSGKDSEHRSLTAAQLKRGVSVAGQGDTPLFVEVAVEGYPVKPPAPKDDRITIERTWWTAKGEAVQGRQFKTGEMLVVRLRVNAKQRVKDGLAIQVNQDVIRRIVAPAGT